MAEKSCEQVEFIFFIPLIGFISFSSGRVIKPPAYWSNISNVCRCCSWLKTRGHSMDQSQKEKSKNSSQYWIEETCNNADNYPVNNYRYSANGIRKPTAEWP